MAFNPEVALFNLLEDAQTSDELLAVIDDYLNEDEVQFMTHIAKIRYVDEQNRSHYIEIESDVADRRHIEELVKCRYPAKEIYFQGVYAK